MTDVCDYQVGDCVRLTRDLPAARAGTEGVVQRVVRDGEQITALTILVAADSASTYGTSVFLHEVEMVRRAPTHEVDDR
jgi:hypothetical protein